MGTSALQFSWHSNVDEIKAEWNLCFDNNRGMKSWELQKTCEASRLSQAEFQHLVVRDEKGVAMLLACCVLRISLVTVADPGIQKFIEGIRKIFPKFLYTRIFFLGSAFSSSDDLIGICDRKDAQRWTKEKMGKIFDEVIRRARSVSTSFVIAKELPIEDMEFLREKLGEKKFCFPESLPTAYLKTGEPGAYLKAINTRYRNKLKKRKATATEKNLYWTTGTEGFPHLDAMFDLHSQIMDNADVQFERLHRPFFTEAHRWMQPMEKTFYTWGFQKLSDGKEKLICSEFIIPHGDTLYPVYTGFDYSIKHGSDLYFNAYYKLIEEAELRGYKNIHLGQTAYEVKAELGCTFTRLFLAVHHTNPVIFFFLKKLQKIFFALPKIPQRDVYATPPTPPKNSKKPASSPASSATGTKAPSGAAS